MVGLRVPSFIYFMVPQSLHTSKLSAVGGQWSVVSNGNGNTFVHEGPRRTTKNGNGNTFIREGTRRGAKNGNGNTFVRGGSRRGAEDGNGNTFVRGGRRRGAEDGNGNFSDPRRDAEDCRETPGNGRGRGLANGRAPARGTGIDCSSCDWNCDCCD